MPRQNLHVSLLHAAVCAHNPTTPAASFVKRGWSQSLESALHHVGRICAKMDQFDRLLTERRKFQATGETMPESSVIGNSRSRGGVGLVMTNWRLTLALITLSPVSSQPAAAQQGAAASNSALPLTQRIARADAAKYQRLSDVHDGAGSMDFRVMLGADALDTNLIFFHRGVILPKSSIGEHFHNQCEEMFVILDGEAQFTMDGHTSVIKGPAGVPDRIGHAHAINNATDKPVRWLNINVGFTKTYDAFNLGDPRAGVPLEPIPQFISMRLDRSLLKPMDHMDGGSGPVQYRRVLQPSVFFTTWSYFDEIFLSPRRSVGAVLRALI